MTASYRLVSYRLETRDGIKRVVVRERGPVTEHEEPRAQQPATSAPKVQG